jgi:DNA (cytosine-5)-methyltransferase 1
MDAAPTHLDLFSGIGGFALAARWAGFRTIGFCEIDAFPAAVLRRHWPGIPNFGDVRNITSGSADIITGGFPCQDISCAGSGLGLEGERSGLWREFHRIIRDIRPRFALVENVAALSVRGLLEILRDLSEIGFDAEWSNISACAVGATHMRRRMFIVAYPHGFDGWQRLRDSTPQQNGKVQTVDSFASARAGWKARMANPSALYRDSYGLPNRMERNRAIGNSVCPQVAYEILREIRKLI